MGRSRGKGLPFRWDEGTSSSQRYRTEWSTLPQKGNYKGRAMAKLSGHRAALWVVLRFGLQVRHMDGPSLKHAPTRDIAGDSRYHVPYRSFHGTAVGDPQQAVAL